MLLHFLAVLLLSINISKYQCLGEYNNGIGRMIVIQGYDDYRRTNPIKMKDENDNFVNSLFRDLSGIKESDASNLGAKMLSGKADSSKLMHDTATYSKVIRNISEQIVKLQGDYSYDNYKIPNNYCLQPKMNYPCDPTYPYRSFDGSCNNLDYPWWGAWNTPYKRILRPAYDDGFDAMRQVSVVPNYFLPNSRLVAITLHRAYPTKSVWSNYGVSFGQVLAHSLAHTWAPVNPDGSDLNCDVNMSNREECFNIPVPENDYYWKKDRDATSLWWAFTRNAPSVRDYDCNFGPREQFSRYSHFLNLGIVYNNAFSSNTRWYHGGLLRFSVNSIGEVSFPLKYGSSCPYANGQTYHTGDIAGEQNSYLTSLQIVWLRNHNQLADELQKINNHWDDETLFQQARKINIALFNHVTYNEYLPSLIGPAYSKLYGLYPLTWGYTYNYNPKLYNSISNEFVTAGFRLHHLISEEQCYADSYLRKFNCHSIWLGMKNSTGTCYGIDDIIRGQIATQSYYSTPQLSWSMNNDLLKGKDSIGVRNVQRGRDHGLPSYNYYRELCGLNRARNFDELKNIPPTVRKVLAALYYHVDDIDLYSGSVAELPLPDAFIGWTQSCIIAKQFQDFKIGDRFYYEHGHSVHTRFTPDQLNFIRGVSVASIMCRNVELTHIQKWPFLAWHPVTNPHYNCKTLTYGSLKAWKEIPSY